MEDFNRQTDPPAQPESSAPNELRSTGDLPDLPELRGLPVTVMGLGRHGGGIAAIRWLVAQGARVSVTDSAPADTLTDSIRVIEDLPLERRRFGGHHSDDFRDARLIVPNPGVRPGDPYLLDADARGIPRIGEIELFIRRCEAPIIGITGSNGKSTTATLTAAILKAAGHRVYLGGNIGVSLLPQLREIKPGDHVILELSSFQLYHMREDWPGVDVAVVTGFSPNHLDWHGTLDRYRAAKQRILETNRGMIDRPAAVLPPWDTEVDHWGTIPGRRRLPIVNADMIPEMPAVPGVHNQRNARLAASIFFALTGQCSESMPNYNICHDALQNFDGLPMRLQRVLQRADRWLINDSAATTPQSVTEAVRALAAEKRPLWLLIGGKNKGLDFRPLFRQPALNESNVRGVAFFGLHGPELFREFQACQAVAKIAAAPIAQRMETLDEALRWTFENSQSGDTIVLSPGCAATDQYVNYVARGLHFDRLVREIKLG